MPNENLSRKQKIAFIKSVNISIADHIPDIDSIHNLALVKDVTKLECFGYIDPEDAICKQCCLNTNGTCQNLSNHIKKLQANEYSNRTVALKDITGKEFKVESIDLILEKLTMSKNSNEFKIAQKLLEMASNNKPLSIVFSDIGTIIGSEDVKRQQFYFYKVRKRIESECNVKIEIVVVKYITLMKGS